MTYPAIFDRDINPLSWFDPELSAQGWFDPENIGSTGQLAATQAGRRSLFLGLFGLNAIPSTPKSLLLYKPIGRRIAPLLRF